MHRNIFFQEIKWRKIPFAEMSNNREISRFHANGIFVMHRDALITSLRSLNSQFQFTIWLLITPKKKNNNNTKSTMPVENCEWYLCEE